MAGCNKMSRAGLQSLRETFMNNPNIPFTQLLALYNMKAVDRGWRCLKSSGTLSYHLNAMGLYKYNTRHIVPHEKKGYGFIKADASQQEAIAKQFFTTTRTVRSALNFETNSPFAKTLRAYALNHGCKMYEVTLIDNPYEKVKTL